jgi:hypothetical protein
MASKDDNKRKYAADGAEEEAPLKKQKTIDDDNDDDSDDDDNNDDNGNDDDERIQDETSIMKQHKLHFTTWLKELNIPIGGKPEEKMIYLLAAGPHNVVKS